MSNNEQNRRDVYRFFEELMGDQLAGKMMDMIPMYPHTELATRSDLQALAAQLQGEMAELRGELRGEMVALRASTEGQLAELRADVNGTLHLELGRLYRWGAGIIVANGVAIVTALIT